MSGLRKQGKTHWLLIWDNASWHKSQTVRTWIRAHNQQVKQTGKGVRILPFLLPTQSPWLNPIEPKWVHAKRHVVEPNGVLSAASWPNESVLTFGVPMNPILLFPKRSHGPLGIWSTTSTSVRRLALR